MEKTHLQLWEECRQFIKDNIPSAQYDAWFRDVASLSFDNMSLTLVVPSAFFVEQLEERYLGLLGAAIRQVYGRGVKLYYQFNQVKDEPKTAVNMRSAEPSPAILNAGAKTSPTNPFAPQPVGDIDPQLNPRYNFENYCCSMSNKVAWGIGQSIANDPKIKTFNPLFIFGSTGVGKTHLIQAIGIRVKERNPQAKVLYVTARLFQSQYTTAEAKGTTNSFFHFYQSIDTLIVDDIQDLRDKPATQNTFFHIFNHLHQNQKQIILSSDCCPTQLKGMTARLISRFKWGMTVELEKPDLALRRMVLQLKSEQDGLSLAPEVMDFIAENVTNSVRELEGIVVSLLAHATVLNREVTVDLARHVMNNVVKLHKKASINFEMIAQGVASHYKIDSDLLFAKTRKREVSDARQMVMYMAKKYAKMSLTAIGARLSRNYATVIHGCKNIEERLPYEKQLQEDVASIEKAILA